jgi:predicted Ser/Thr protein kinase
VICLGIPVGDPRLRIPFSELKVGDELGKTYATKVCMGEYNHTPVAIKFLKRPAFVDTFFKDATILLYVSSRYYL